MGHGAGAVPLSISRPPTGGDRMEFRILTERDAEAFHHLYREALQTYPEAFYRTPEEGVGTVEEVAAFLRERGGPDDFVLGAFDGETLVGMVGFVRNTVVKTRHRGHIWGMYVRPDRQGRGIAYRLMEALINRAKPVPDWSRSPSPWSPKTGQPKPCMRNGDFKSTAPIPVPFAGTVEPSTRITWCCF